MYLIEGVSLYLKKDVTLCKVNATYYLSKILKFLNSKTRMTLRIRDCGPRL